MKQTFTKILLLSFIAVLMGVTGSTLSAKEPATPERIGIKVDIKESFPVQGDITLTWIDGDRNNPLGDYFRITQYKKVDGKETEERVGKVEKNNKGEYKFQIKDLAPAVYCYSIDLYDTEYDIASGASERVCGTVGEDNNFRKMYFNCELKLIKLDELGQGKFFVDVVNNTKCEFEVKVLETNARVEVSEQGEKGALLKVEADEKGKYVAVLGLVDACSGEIVDRVELLICYGDCINTPDERMGFIKERISVKLDDNGVSRVEIGIYNNTDCEYKIMVVESKVKIAVLEQGEKGALLELTADEEGRYESVIGLQNVCTGEIVSKMVLDICYGDCDPNEKGLYFEKGTEFSHVLGAGVEWRYDVNAISKNDCEISYYLSDHTGGNNSHPEGLKLDEKTGVLSWENPVEGRYFIVLIAQATCDEGITYERLEGGFYLNVTEKEPDYTSVLKCNFYDVTDEVKDFYGKVSIWSADRDANTPNKMHFYKTVELNGTSIEVKLPAGKYYLKADVKGYRGQYYEEAFTLKEAVTIGVPENERVEVRMMLHALPTPDFHVVSGQVVDAATGEPLPAIVTFIPVKWLKGDQADRDEKDEVLFDNQVRTDEEGNYSIKLPNTFEYYAFAEVLTNSGMVYKKQWYEGADTYYEANIIKLLGDKDGVNFKMQKREVEQGYMSGSVVNREGNVVPSTVIAFYIGESKETDFKAVTKTDEKGNFYFENLRYGNYILLSIPNGYSYYPGYYVMGDLVTLRWKKATRVSVGDFAPTVLLEIIHQKAERDEARGIAKLKGRLIKALRGMVASEEGDDESEYINGGLVSLVDENSEIVGHYVTDSEGYFEIDGLAPGTYTLNIDKFGYEEYSETIEVDYTKEVEIETDIELNLSAVTSVDYGNFNDVNLSVSPMPVNSVSTITFEGTAGNSDIRIVDMTGNTVYQTTISTISGINQFDFDSNGIPAGAYIVVINGNEISVAGGITIVK